MVFSNVIELWWLTTSLQVFLSREFYCEMILILLEHWEVIEAGSGHGVVRKKLKRGEVYVLQSNNGTKVIKWKDKRDVLMISTKPSHSATLVETGKTNKSNERVMKPQVIVDYNKGKQGIDLSDQLSTYYTCLRRSKKWYQKVTFEMIFEVSIVNAYLIYKENYDTSRTAMLQFRESLVRSLLLGAPYENLKPGPRERYNKSNETQAGGLHTRREGRVYAQCWQAVHWLLCEGKGRTVKRSEQRSSKESENFLFWLW